MTRQDPIVEHDFSAVEELLRQQQTQREKVGAAEVEGILSPLREEAVRNLNDRIRAQGDRRRKTGLGFLAGGVGLAAVIAAAAYYREPKIIETTKVVTEMKVERVEIPKTIIQDRVVTIDKPVVVEKVIEKQVPPPMAPAPSPAPAVAPAQPVTPTPSVGERSTPDRFKSSEGYQRAAFNGKVTSFTAGTVRFETGESMTAAEDDGTPDTSITTAKFNGDLAFCSDTLVKFPNGKPRWECRVLHGGKVENLFAAESDKLKPQADPIAELFKQ